MYKQYNSVRLSDSTTRVWEIGDDRAREFFYSPLRLHTYSVNGVDFTREGTLFATCSTDGTCGVHETEVLAIFIAKATH